MGKKNTTNVGSKAKEKTIITQLKDNNGLRMKNKEEKLKEKRFSFFADPQERKAESPKTFGTLPFARHTRKIFTKVKEPILSQQAIKL